MLLDVSVIVVILLKSHIVCKSETAQQGTVEAATCTSPAQNQFDLELWYKVFFSTDSCRLDIAINDSG